MQLTLPLLPLLTLLTTLTTLTTATTTSTIVGVLIPDWSVTIPSYTSTGATVVSINALETTYKVSCLSGAATSLCHIDHPWTMIQGETTASFTGVYTAWSSGSDAVTATRDWACSFTSLTESVSCSLSYQATGTYDGSTYATSTSTKAKFATDKVQYDELLVTGGVNSFTAPAATETPGVAAGGVVGPARAMVTAAVVAVAAAVI
ncbi:hypothetical protein BO70DRAFT_365903 [Aspergillus heteromorphus CBS 117.55]|uniref:Ig-like domain-containing protein n=1 Tax=Aspergillus heteromorphus CBS 117.55 TaxID=1448321 RepID=A0A317V8C8_9EURO|nr:uncharacterized protein BO70DRAFT_365903 [Aspergillus heteromorphus CBS 117.55]PWY69092.1 hypothetical protein BO70DRAFT_365903 [Aspergillus heteromorphus CBS 117.55]